MVGLGVMGRNLLLNMADHGFAVAGYDKDGTKVEALRQELSYFVQCVSSGQQPINDGCAGLRVVKMLEAASESLNKRGSLVYL